MKDRKTGSVETLPSL